MHNATESLTMYYGKKVYNTHTHTHKEKLKFKIHSG